MEIIKGIHYVGSSTSDLDLFEGQYIVPDGMAFNSYLLIDDVTILFDTVDDIVKDKWMENLTSALNGRELDYLIVQHVEPDHSSQIGLLINKYPNLKIISNEMSFKMMYNFFKEDYSSRKIVVKDGEEFKTNNFSFKFIFTPMIHWPEVMMTYEENTKTFFSADAFGKFGSLDIEQSWACEARRYYFNIVGKYGLQVQTLLKKVSLLDIENILPLHGPYLQSNLSYYINLYDIWSSYRPEVNGVFIAYNSVYGNTKEACELLYKTLKEKDVKVSISDLSRSDMAENLEDAFKYSHLVLGATTYNMTIFPIVNEFIDHLLTKNFQNRTIAIIENGSWASCSARLIVKKFEGIKNISFMPTTISITSSLSSDNLIQIAKLADEISNDVKND